MKTIRNCTGRPLKIALPKGKFLHLGPKNTGSVHPDALERPATKRLLETGDLEIVDDSVDRPDGGPSSMASVTTHGRGHDSSFRRKGDR